MGRFVGLDVHKRVIQAAIIDARGVVLLEHRFTCSRNDIRAFARQYLRKPDQVALEATTNTWGVVALLKPFVAEVVVSNPLRTKAIAAAKIKTDKVDALVLAQLLRTDFLPRVWEPDDQTQELRSLTGRRARLVQDRTAIKNRIHSVLHQRLITTELESEALFGTDGVQWLKGLDLDVAGRIAIDADIQLLDEVNRHIDGVDLVLARKAWQDDRVKLLMTQPGVDVAVAQAVIAALGDISRFRDGDHAASYLGLVPSTRKSASTCYHGPITKQGNGHARSMLVQAAQHVGRHPGPLGHFFRRLARKKNRNVAVVATARKLVVIAWHMLTNNEAYRYATPKSTGAKLATLRVKATGKRRPTRTTLKPAKPNSLPAGKRTRTYAPIDTVLQQEGLPAPRRMSLGERKMVVTRGLAGFLKTIHSTQRILGADGSTRPT